MSKEKIACQVSCHPFGHSGDKGEFRGPSTHCRSEGTWILAIALNMARHGHDVTIIGYQLGDPMKYPIPNNVTVHDIQYPPQQIKEDFDIFIDPGWDNINAPKRCEEIKSKIYIHGWGGSPYSSELLSYVTPRNIKNHFMARPSRGFQKEYIGYPYGIYMPHPLVDKIKDKGNFSSKKMLWGNRGAFYKESNTDYSIVSEKVLEFMEKWQSKYKYKILLWGDIIERARNSGRTDIIKRFENLKEKELIEPYIGIGHDEFLNELNESKILLDTAHPGVHPQNLEAICMGAIPLIWKNETRGEHHFQKTDEEGNSIYINNLFNVDGPHGMDRIINSEELYQQYFKNLKDVTIDHEYDTSYKIFINQIREKI